MKEGVWFVYILASRRNGTLYIGTTNSLLKRIDQHRQSWSPNSFTSKYNITRLVYYEVHSSSGVAVRRERRLKKWNRLWKMKLIETVNPEWKDLYPDIIQLYT